MLNDADNQQIFSRLTTLAINVILFLALAQGCVSYTSVEHREVSYFWQEEMDAIETENYGYR